MSRSKYVQSNFWPVFFLATAVFLACLAHKPVPTIDGAVYSSVARNILETGQWFPNMYLDRLFAEHPPLFVWSIAGFMKLFGINDFGANFSMHFFSFLCVLVTYWVAIRAGFPRGSALAASVILCGTRDFVLSGVRGYIEPLLIFWIYLSFYFAVAHLRKFRFYWPVLSGVVLSFAWLAKGPPALWPTVYFPFLFFIFVKGFRRKLVSAVLFFLPLLAMGYLFFWFTEKTDPQRVFWNHYINKQILGSALEGRGGAQTNDYFFFFHIFWRYYQPWIFLLPAVVWLSLLEIWKKFRGTPIGGVYFPGLEASLEKIFQRPLASWVFIVFACGFIGGFSLVKWRFWYYVTPAYPALALAISRTLCYPLANIFERPLFSKAIAGGACLWILIAAVFPVKTYRDRVPEITAFQDIINKYPEKLPLWLLHGSRDHNLIATSGEWVFHREVKKVESLSDLADRAQQQKSWIIMEKNFYEECQKPADKKLKLWCGNLKIYAQADSSYLVLH